MCMDLLWMLSIPVPFSLKNYYIRVYHSEKVHVVNSVSVCTSAVRWGPRLFTYFWRSCFRSCWQHVLIQIKRHSKLFFYINRNCLWQDHGSMYCWMQRWFVWNTMYDRVSWCLRIVRTIYRHLHHLLFRKIRPKLWEHLQHQLLADEWEWYQSNILRQGNRRL